MEEGNLIPELFMVLTTEENYYMADELSKSLLHKRLAACITLQRTSSRYWWDGKLTQSDEVQLLIKTTEDQLSDLLETIKKNHSYETPELIYWNASAGQVYKEWVSKVIANKF